MDAAFQRISAIGSLAPGPILALSELSEMERNWGGTRTAAFVCSAPFAP